MGELNFKKVSFGKFYNENRLDSLFNDNKYIGVITDDEATYFLVDQDVPVYRIETDDMRIFNVRHGDVTFLEDNI